MVCVRKKEVNTNDREVLGRLIVWSGHLSGLQRKRKGVGHTSVYRVGVGSRKVPPWTCPKKPEKDSQNLHPLSKGCWDRKELMPHFNQVNS